MGHCWRYRYDKFGWTTRSSQLYERRLLRWGSPLFHFGILVVFVGHVMGLGVPKSWTEAVGISEDAVPLRGRVASARSPGCCTVVGMAILIYRRRTVGPVFRATTRMDKVMYAVPGRRDPARACGTPSPANIFGGTTTTARACRSGSAASSASTSHPELMAEAPLGFQLHGLVAFAAVRAVAVHPAGARVQRPLGYLTRPYIVYRSREDVQGNRPTKRGWEKVQ